MALVVKSPPANAGDEARVRSLGQEDPREESMATHSSILVWRVPWTEEPGGHRVAESDTTEVTQHACALFQYGMFVSLCTNGQSM